MTLPYGAELLDNGNYKIDGAEFTEDKVLDSGCREIHRTEGSKLQRKADKAELDQRRDGTWEE